jgi:hypothetical protein
MMMCQTSKLAGGGAEGAGTGLRKAVGREKIFDVDNATTTPAQV